MNSLKDAAEKKLKMTWRFDAFSINILIGSLVASSHMHE